jgi:hypothetical protein
MTLEEKSEAAAKLKQERVLPSLCLMCKKRYYVLSTTVSPMTETWFADCKSHQTVEVSEA